MQQECSVCDYGDVRQRLKDLANPVLVAGNGLSLSFAKQSLDWEALRASVSAECLSDFAKRAFEVSAARDFESAARVLHESAHLLKRYEPILAARLEQESRDLCKLTAQAVAAAHPQRGARPDASKVAACARFLSDYQRVVTLNYDLLLYWVVVSANDACSRDGFGNCRPDDPKAVCWQGPNSQPCIEYLHGALHLFVDALETKKLRADDEDLMTKITRRIASGLFPLVVSGPTAKVKAATIGRSPYLRSVLHRLSGHADAIVTFGWSASPQDRHVVDAILRSDCELVCIGCHGLRGGLPTGDLTAFARNLIQIGKEVILFDTEPMNVWGI